VIPTWLLPGRAVPSGICDSLWMISRDGISSTNIGWAGVVAALYICGLMTADTVNLVSSDPIHWSSWPCLPILAVSLAQDLAASAGISRCAAVQFGILCPPPSWVCHLRSACPDLKLHQPHYPHPPHRLNMRDHTDCIWVQLSSPQMFLQAPRLSILRFQLFVFRPGPA